MAASIHKLPTANGDHESSFSVDEVDWQSEAAGAGGIVFGSGFEILVQFLLRKGFRHQGWRPRSSRLMRPGPSACAPRTA